MGGMFHLRFMKFKSVEVQGNLALLKINIPLPLNPLSRGDLPRLPLLRGDLLRIPLLRGVRGVLWVDYIVSCLKW